MPDPITRLNAALEGRYRIERELGEGGMATVYLADDLKHERKVALKVLKPELAAVVGAERFLAEIKTTANLQHPNILPLFDSGEADSFLFYVMPYVEGESLRHRLDREHQLPVDEAVRIASDLGEALDYAHSHGVIHRDIKPANILLQAGKPVISDFGIALAVGAAGGGRLTETGLSLGTPHYMSPEQATGDQHVGPATDIYALGCVLYEMLVGEPPYTGSTAQAILGRIITGDPKRPSEHRRTIPPHVEWAILRSLEKLPADRFASAEKLVDALSDASARPPAGGGRARDSRPKLGGAERLLWSVLVVTSVLVAVMMSRRGDTAPVHVARLNVVIPDSAPLTFIGAAPLGYGRPAFAVSDDGTQMVYTGLQDGTVRLFLRSFDSFEATAMPGTGGAFGPFFSPNGSWVGFFVGNQLMKVRTEGGAPIPIVEAPNALGADWADGQIVYVADEGDRLLRVPEEGGDVVDLTVPGRYQQWPRALPGSDAIMVSPGGTASPWILDPTSGEVTDLPFEGDDARYVSSGHLLFIRGSDLYAVEFDLEKLAVTGPSVPVLTGVRTEIYGLGQWELTNEGTLVYAVGRDVAEGRFTWVNSDATRSDLALSTRARGTFEISPDGTRLAVVEEAPGQNHIWIYDLERGTPRQLTVAGMNWGPLAWSPDGAELIYHTVLDDTLDVPYVQGVDEGGLPRRLSPDEGEVKAFSWSAGGLIGLSRADRLMALDPENGERVDIPSTDRTSWGMVISPNGDAVAYTSGHTGEYHNYVQPLPPTGQTRQVSLAGGAEEPRWSRDGKLLYYRSGQRIMVATVTTEPALSVGVPSVFFEGDFVNVGGRSYDISVDGGRALIIDGGVGSTTTLRVVEGWITEVERLLREAQGAGR